ncbi:NAD(P)-binding protein [Aspergillus indologenus CBS 114.80]|uniref:NAD(P)-binding protein n=1 Tax=Aspergillus indologenus CBS 114.80 TaxID=1450541 RepID=A0A2V5J2Z7_9EURO|nr:NAD(P)-binding protein [Aspergillus indologenus CBS 114.80]
MARIFLTGASGYIGGDVLHALRSALPKCDYSVLLRDEEKAKKVQAAYPNVRVVIGDLDAAAVIEKEATHADIVIHAASTNHIKSVEAIARGLSAEARTKPGYWIQMSGASVLSMPDIEHNNFGQASSSIYSDVDGAEEVHALIKRYSSKRIVDNFVANLPPTATRPKTALIFGPIIYGRGRGIVKQRSIQIPELARATLQRREGVQVGKGESTWSNIHIADLSNIFVKLVEKALENADGELWNEDGLYFPVNTAMLSFKEISQRIAQEVYKLGLADSTSVKEVDPSEADSITPHAAVILGTNAKQVAQRARHYLNWVPERHTLEEEIPLAVSAEVETLGLA